MEVISTYKFARVSARKARDVAREIQGLPVSAALDILNFTPRKSAHLIGKTMKAALADAENNFDLEVDSLTVKEATIGEGPTFKRFKARAKGSASAIRKRTSHIRIVLSDEVIVEDDVPVRSAEQPVEVSADPDVVQSVASGGGDRGHVYDEKPEDADDLKQIDGVGPKIEEKLNGFGIYKFEQIAAWTEENIAEFDQLLSFKGRIERDEWVKKAKDLAAG